GEGGHREPPGSASSRRILEREPVALKDQVAGARGLQPDPDLLIVGRRRDPVETVELGLPAARLTGALPGFVATDELLGARDVLLLGVVLLLSHGPALAAQPQVLAIVARIP